jgi:geranylgeranyl pyrophosphate synthase
MSGDFEAFHAEIRAQVEAKLDDVLPQVTAPPTRLHEAMRYSVLAGGKRIRPLLVILGGEAHGGRRELLLYGAAAVELMHTFSLIHDDLPALDDDAMRRGRPTLHRTFDEATAILAGDALLNLGFELLSTGPAGIREDRRAWAVALLAGAVGSEGMIGGQMADLEAEAHWPDEPEQALEMIHRRKTGRLIAAALRLGGLYADGDAETDRRLDELGRAIGLIFQIADDILDVEGSSDALGKTARKDAAARKLTYPALFGIDGARARLGAEQRRALDLAAQLPAGGRRVADLIHFIGERDH